MEAARAKCSNILGALVEEDGGGKIAFAVAITVRVGGGSGSRYKFGSTTIESAGCITVLSGGGSKNIVDFGQESMDIIDFILDVEGEIFGKEEIGGNVVTSGGILCDEIFYKEDVQW